MDHTDVQQVQPEPEGEPWVGPPFEDLPLLADDAGGIDSGTEQPPDM